MKPVEFRREFMRATRSMQGSIHKTVAPICQGHGLTVLQLCILTELSERPGLTASQVSERVGILRTNFAPVCRKLEEDGLLEKRPGETDKRTIALHVTDKGRALISSVDENVNSRFEEAFAAEPAETFDDIVRGLHLLRRFSEKLP